MAKRKKQEINHKQNYGKHPKEELSESGQMYRNLVERANDGICIIQDNIVRYINSYLAEMWGGSVEEVINNRFTDYIHPDEVPQLVERYQQRIAGKEVLPMYETILRRKDDSDVYVELNASIIHYNEKPADLVFIRNITKRKQAEEAQRDSEERFRGFINSATDSFVLFDSELNIIQLNDKHIEMFHPGMDKESLIGKNLLTIVPDLKESERYDDFMKVIETGIPFHSEDIVPRMKFGNKYLSVKAFKMADGLGTITRDITERKQSEKRINHLNQVLRGIRNVNQLITK